MALIKRVPTTLNFDFMGLRRLTLMLSAVLVLLSVGLVAVAGLNLGVDFRGGIVMEVRTKAAEADVQELRERMAELNLGDVSIQTFGAPNDVLIRIQEQTGGEDAQAAAIERAREALDDVVEDYRRTEFVGPTVGEELQRAGMLATVLALGAMAVYIWFRFEWQFALAALIALVHDVVTTLGFFAVTQLDFNLGTVAAVLTIAGYSINDTVVTFDRVRETMRRYKKQRMEKIVNIALNGVLIRTLLTSLTTLAALVALAAFGGPVIRSFTWALIWGVVIGTYSSVLLAAPLLIYLGLKPSTLAETESDKEAAARVTREQASS